MCFTANNILLHAFLELCSNVKNGICFPELSQGDLNMKTNLVNERYDYDIKKINKCWTKLLQNTVTVIVL